MQIKSWHDRIFSKSFYKKRTALYLHGDINYSNKSASFGSYLMVIGMFFIIISATLQFENLMSINVYFLPTDHSSVSKESIAKHSLMDSDI